MTHLRELDRQFRSMTDEELAKWEADNSVKRYSLRKDLKELFFVVAIFMAGGVLGALFFGWMMGAY